MAVAAKAAARVAEVSLSVPSPSPAALAGRSGLLSLKRVNGKTVWAFREKYPPAAKASESTEGSSSEADGATALPSVPPYAAGGYWEQRYADRSDQEYFEWYTELAIFKTPLIEALGPTSTRILHVGNGNSRLPQQLWKLGYTNQHANDISPTVTSRMSVSAASCHGLRWAVEDATAMPEHADGSFDAVVDKGTYDALSTNSCDRALVAEVWRVLRPGGVYVLMSSLEVTAQAFEPPRWLHGEWAPVRTTHASGGLRGECWLFCATKREDT